jgi:hypothetical protein
MRKFIGRMVILDNDTRHEPSWNSWNSLNSGPAGGGIPGSALLGSLGVGSFVYSKYTPTLTEYNRVVYFRSTRYYKYQEVSRKVLPSKEKKVACTDVLYTWDLLPTQIYSSNTTTDLPC